MKSSSGIQNLKFSERIRAAIRNKLSVVNPLASVPKGGRIPTTEASNEAEVPLWDVPQEQEFLYRPIFGPFKAGPPEEEFGLSVDVDEDGEMRVLLSFPGPHGAMCPLGPYRKIAEFRAMLSELKPSGISPRGLLLDSRTWNGEHFHGYILLDGESAGYWFRAHRDGITFGLRAEEWKFVQELFGMAWANTDLQGVWATLTEKHGEI